MVATCGYHSDYYVLIMTNLAKVGFMPARPHMALGILTLPPPSVPIVKASKPAGCHLK